jgi:hypothetical protein
MVSKAAAKAARAAAALDLSSVSPDKFSIRSDVDLAAFSHASTPSKVNDFILISFVLVNCCSSKLHAVALCMPNTLRFWYAKISMTAVQDAFYRQLAFTSCLTDLAERMRYIDPKVFPAAFY